LEGIEVDTFPVSLTPDRIKDKEVEYSTKVTKFENEAEQRFGRWHSGKRHWTFVWEVMTPGEFAALEAFFDGQVAQLHTWNYTDQRIGGAKVLRFEEDKIKFSLTRGIYASVEVRVVEC
jgi:hypothetical protein